MRITWHPHILWGSHVTWGGVQVDIGPVIVISFSSVISTRIELKSTVTTRVSMKSPIEVAA